MVDEQPRWRRWRRWAVIAAAVTALYAAFGFLLFPWILHRQLEARLGVALHRPVSIAKVRANPFALSVRIDGLLVRERDGSTPFITWDRLEVNGRILPILRRELTLDALTLAGFQVRVSMGPDGRLNAEDILEAFSTRPEQPPQRQRKGPFVFGVDRLAIDRARIVFVDRSRGHPFETTLGPVTVRLEHFRTRPDSTSPYAFSGTTELGERFSWRGSLLIEPLRSTGELQLDDFRITKYAPYYEQQVGFDLREGRGALRARYQLEWGPAKHEVRISDGEVQVRDLVVSMRGDKTPAVELPAIDVTGIAADLLERTAAVEQVAVRGGTIRARRDREGHLDLARLAPPGPAAGPGDRPPYRWNVHRVSISGYRVELEDAVPDRRVALVLAPIDLELENIASDPRTVTRVDLSAGWNGTGRAKATGSVVAARPAADLRIEASALDLPSLDPYLAKYGDVAARLGGGQLAMSARLRLDRGVEPMTWGFEGELAVSSLILLDAERGEELVRWRDLQLKDVRTASSPPGLTMTSMQWIEPRIHVQIAQDRSTNLRRVLGTPTPPAPPPGDAPQRPRGGPPSYPVSIGMVQVVRGRAGLVDRSVRPPAVLNVTDLDVRIRDLNNQVNARSGVSARALVGGAPLEVKGTLSQRLVNDATRLVVKSKGIDLTPLAPYCAKHVGYVLERGKLDLDLEYRVERRKLDGKNVVRVDQFSLGDKTNSPDATSLPVKLGLALLRDRDGVIDLDVPVSGDVDDPSFSLGGVIWHAVVNVFTKVVTAPFSALGRLFGAGPDDRLDVVDFAPGSAELTPAGEKALQTLVKALHGRPTLRLEIEGTADESGDGQALRRAELRRRARLAKWKAGAAGSLETVAVSEAEYRTWVEAMYRVATPKVPSGPGQGNVAATAKVEPAAPATGEEMEARLLETVQVPPEELPALAQARSEAVRRRLAVSDPPIDADRLFVVQGGDRATKESGPHAYFTLR